MSSLNDVKIIKAAFIWFRKERWKFRENEPLGDEWDSDGPPFVGVSPEPGTGRSFFVSHVFATRDFMGFF